MNKIKLDIFIFYILFFVNCTRAEGVNKHPESNRILNNYEGVKKPAKSETSIDENNCESSHCSVWINDTRSCITNPRYPLADRLKKSYSYIFKIKQYMCGLRVLFKDVIFSPAELLSGDCGVDSIVFINSKYSTTSLCGKLNHYEVDLLFSYNDDVELFLSMQSTEYLWRIMVEQIPCSAVTDKPLNSEVEFICGIGRNTNSISGDLHSIQKNEIFAKHSTNRYISSEKFPEERYFTGSETFKIQNNLKRAISLESSSSEKVSDAPGVLPETQSWMAGIFLKADSGSGRLEYLCSAVVISKNYILTTASCFQQLGQQLDLENIRVIIGANNFSSTEESFRQVYLIQIVKIPPAHRLYHDDIAIAKLDRPIKFNGYTGPVCLPYNTDNIYENNVAWTIGWEGMGKRSLSSALRQVELLTISNNECNKNFQTLGVNWLISSQMICAEEKSGGICNGNTGGPLQIKSLQNRWSVIGTTNLLSEKGCFASKNLNVFTRVSNHMAWISLAVAELQCSDLQDLIFFRGCQRYQ